jgi:glycosyltransferase involved in cell wall biosynthesis
VTPPLASVAVPAYNHARFIGACLESIRDQTYPELELVVVDDGSTDGTGDVVQRFVREHGKRFRRVELIRQENRGVGAASNRAIAACRGEWVHLLGSDDRLYPHKIGAQWRAIQDWGDERLALVYADADLIDEDGAAIPKIAGERPPSGPDPKAYLALVLGNPIPNPTVALHRERFAGLGGFDESLRLEDWDCWLRLATRYALARVPERLAAYRRHGANASLRQPMMLQESWRVLGRFFERHGELIPSPLTRASFRHRMRSFRRWARKNAPALLPGILWDTLRAHVRTPQPEWFYHYASLCDSQY